MIAQELEVSLHMAFVEARQQRHEFITVEHLQNGKQCKARQLLRVGFGKSGVGNITKIYQKYIFLRSHFGSSFCLSGCGSHFACGLMAHA